jgi:hypothetical protein
MFWQVREFRDIIELGYEVELNSDELFLSKTDKVLTALHFAAQDNHIEILHTMCVWAEEWKLNTNELPKIVTSQRQGRGIEWHHAASFGKSEALQTLWCLVMEVELNLDELLLTIPEEGKTALHMAAQENHTEILQKMWVWAEEWKLNTKE